VARENIDRVHAFLLARNATEIEALFGLRLVDPLDDLHQPPCP
jgi:hypothetical protein